MLTVACSTSKRPDADPAAFEPGDPAVLAAAARRTAGEEFRYRSVLSVEGGDGDEALIGELLDVTGMTRILDVRGTVAGDDRSVKVKTSLIAGYLDGLDADLPRDPVGLQTEARRVEGTWYVRAPRTLLIAALQRAGAELPGDSELRDQLVSGWVRIDPAGSEETLADVERWTLLDSRALQVAMDPLDLLDALDELDEVEVAPGTFDGEAVTVVRGTARLRPAPAPRSDPGADPIGFSTTSSTTTSTPDHIDDVPVQVEVAIAEDGTVRSASYGMTFRDLLALAVPVADLAPSGAASPFSELRQVVRTTFSAIGEDHEVVVPDVYAEVRLDGAGKATDEMDAEDDV